MQSEPEHCGEKLMRVYDVDLPMLPTSILIGRNNTFVPTQHTYKKYLCTYTTRYQPLCWKSRITLPQEMCDIFLVRIIVLLWYRIYSMSTPCKELKSPVPKCAECKNQNLIIK